MRLKKSREVPRIQAKSKIKKVTMARVEVGEIRLRNTKRRDQRIKVRSLFMQSGGWSFNIYFVDNFLKLFGPGVTNFVILFM